MPSRNPSHTQTTPTSPTPPPPPTTNSTMFDITNLPSLQKASTTANNGPSPWLLLPPEILHQILDLLPQNDLINICLSSKYLHKLSLPHLYKSIIVTDAYPMQGEHLRYRHYGTIILYKLHYNFHRPKLSLANKIPLLHRTLRDNPALMPLIQSFITDSAKPPSALIDLLRFIAIHSVNLQRLEYSASWLQSFTWNIDSGIAAKESLENILTHSFRDIDDLSKYKNLATLKVLKPPVSQPLRQIFKPSEILILRNLKSLAIEDISFAKILQNMCSGTDKLRNLRSFTYKIDCLSTPRKDEFNFDVLEGFLEFNTIKNFKLIMWYTEENEQYAVNFLSKLNPNLSNVENFELKRTMMAYTIESPTFNDIFTLTNMNYQHFCNHNLGNLRILQLSGDYLNKNFITESRNYANRAEQRSLFQKNFTQIFKNCLNLRVLIIDEFISVRNSSKLLKFFYQSRENNAKVMTIRNKLRKLAAFGYSQYYIDALDDDFDENVDSTEYDLIFYCLQQLRQNYIKFSSLDDPSFHFFQNLEIFDYSGKENKEPDFISKINYIKSLHGNIDFHKRFHHQDKSWKMAEHCHCTSNDYKLVTDLLTEVTHDYIQILADNLKKLRLVILNGLFFKIDDNVGKQPRSFTLLFE